MNALWFFAQRKCPIHFREFPGSTALPQRFCNNCQAGVLFRLGAISFHLRLHGRHSAYSLPDVNVQVDATVPGSALLIQGGLRRTSVTVAAQTLQSRHLIRYRHGRIEIVNRKGLKAAACESHAVISRTFNEFLEDIARAQLRLDLGGRDEGRYSPPNPAYKTWNNCPPNFTVQDGLCKPYRGR